MPGENSYNAEGLGHPGAQEDPAKGENPQRISILAQTYQIKGGSKQPKGGATGSGVGKDYFQFDSEETTTNLTTKVSNLQSKLTPAAG